MAREGTKRTGAQMAHEERMVRFRLWEQTIRFAGIASWIVASVIPLLAVNSIASKLAGHTTNVRVALSVTIGITVALSGVVLATRHKLREQGKELVRLRERAERLEAELLRCKGGQP